MNEAMRYQQSISAEFLAIKDRVRFFIQDNHWGEDGSYKEVILMNYLKRILPNNVSVGTGFVKNNDGELTSQIDIIIYQNSAPKLFSEGDFVILMPESVLGIIEVKSKSTKNIFYRQPRKRTVIEKIEDNGRIIGNKNIFNGIFAYDNEIKFTNNFLTTSFAKQLCNTDGYLNNISLGTSKFLKYWENGNPEIGIGRKSFSAYELSYNNILEINADEKTGFAYGYFISNLLESVYSQIDSEVLTNQYFEFLYPLEGTKEMYRVENCELFLQN